MAPKTRNTFFLFYIFLMHISPLFLVFHFSLHLLPLVILFYFLYTCVGVSMTYHRHFAHKAWTPHPWFVYFGSLLGVIGLAGSPISWASMHKHHHMFPDQPGDPHSPKLAGLLGVYFSPLTFQANPRFVRSLIRSPYQKFLHRNFIWINLTYDLILFAIHPILIIYCHLFPALLLWLASWSINGFGHIWGYRNFDLRDSSHNNILLGYLVFGEGWHNNHHRFPQRTSYSVKKYELDVSGILINFFKKGSYR